MALREINIPPTYSHLVGGSKGEWQRVSLESTSDFDVARQLATKFGIPFGAANSFATSLQGDQATAGTIALSRRDKNKAAVEQNKKFAVGANNVVGVEDVNALPWEQALESINRGLDFSRETSATGAGTTGDINQRLTQAAAAEAMSGIGGGTKEQGKQFLPEWLKSRTPKPFSVGMGDMDGTDSWDPGMGGSSDPSRVQPPQGPTGDFEIAPSLDEETGIETLLRNAVSFEERSGGATSFGESLGIDEIIGMFYVGGKFGDALLVDEETGVETLNPLLGQLLDQADLQSGRVSFGQIADTEARSREKVAMFNKDAAIEMARQNNLSDVEVARLTSEADTEIAEARLSADRYVASREGRAAEKVAKTQGEAMKAAASSQAGGVTGAAESARLGQEAAAESARSGQEVAAESARKGQEAAAESARLGQTSAASSMAGSERAAAQAAAAAASPFGFMSQNYNQASRDADLKSIYEEINKVGLAQAQASNIAAQDNPYGYAAGQVDAFGKREFRPNELAQIGANTPAAFAARGQEAAASQQATGFGALSNLAFGDPRSGQVRQILQAQAANNPYAATQLGQEQSRIDQILRGGLNPEQRLAEINASQSGQNQANFLNFIGNPSAVGFATERGLFGGGNNQILQDINNSPEGNIPGSYLGLNSSPTANTGNSNPNLNTMRGWNDEKIGFEQGVASARGRSPSQFRIDAEADTPQGV